MNMLEKNTKKNRLGLAITSFIFSLISTFSFVVSLISIAINNTPLFGMFSIGTLLFAPVSLILGLLARKSSDGRGFAYAAITLSCIPITLTIFIIFLFPIILDIRHKV